MADADTDDRPDVDAIAAVCDLKCELAGVKTAPRETHREMPSSLRWRARR